MNMMKKLMVVMVAAMALGVHAASEDVDGVTWYYNTFSSEGKTCAEITSGDVKYAGALTIPSPLGGNPVTSIGSYAFFCCSGLTSVTFPEGVTNIGEQAFSGCSGLTNVVIPLGVTSIGDRAFYGCSEIKSVTIPAGGLPLSSIFPDAYKKIEEAIIPEGVTSIGSSAFRDCSGLTEVTIPSSVTSIGASAFLGCNGLTSVSIPSSVMSIGDYAFESCSGLTSVTIPASVTNIGRGAFLWCRGLRSVTIPEGVMNIGDSAFSSCNGLTLVSIPASVTSIGVRAFSGCPIQVVTVDPRNRFYRVKRGRLESYGGTVLADCSLLVTIVSSAIRENDPTVMDVVYKVRSLKPTVKVRVLAFEDGQRSFAKVVRPETFVDGTAVSVGDNIEPNVEHKISWRVSGDWKTKLAKVKFEVLASEGDLLPLETRTIPASDKYGKMKITWNAITDSQVFDALMWLYADKDPGLTLSGGVLRGNGVNLARGTELGHKTYDWSDDYWDFDYRVNATKYVLQKMGYSLLTGVPLTYANQETRLGLSPSGARQYGYKIVE